MASLLQSSEPSPLVQACAVPSTHMPSSDGGDGVRTTHITPSLPQGSEQGLLPSMVADPPPAVHLVC